MRVLVTSEQRFVQSADGRVWTDSQCPYSFWTRYLEVFDCVHVFARVQRSSHVSDAFVPASGDGVRFLQVPYFVGPSDYLRNWLSVRAAVLSAAAHAEAVVLRLPSTIGASLGSRLRRLGRPFGVEVVGDPNAVFAPGASDHPLRAVWRWYFASGQRRLCRAAICNAYVTERTLQALYPPRRQVWTRGEASVTGGTAPFVTHYSSVVLRDVDFVATSRGLNDPPSPARVVMVGSLAEPYKGCDVLLHAQARLHQRRRAIVTTIVGDGKYRSTLEGLARGLGIGSLVRFVGNIPPGAAVRSVLDGADLFVLPSRTEGLPRAMIEAMARALPCIGTNVGGIPELLRPCDLVDSDNPSALADKIDEVCANPLRLREMSAVNLEKARGFHNDVLGKRRREWLSQLRHITERNRRG